MNFHIKSHHQLAKAHTEEDILAIETPIENSRSKVLKQVRSLHIKRNLLQANKNSEAFIGHQSPDTDDPFGGVLRRLRLQQGVEAFVVASKTCISVWQLYELETGKDTLFYTPGLRHKAAQRVATFLGSDWSEILEGRVIAQATPAPTAQLHLLKTAFTDGRSKHAQTDPTDATGRGHRAHETAAAAPLSAAMFLRVADIQKC